MGIRCWCPNGHKLNIKAFQAGKRGICPYCGARFTIPTESTRKPGMGDRIPEPLEHSVHEGPIAMPPVGSFPEPLGPSGIQPGEPAPILSAPTPLGPLSASGRDSFGYSPGEVQVGAVGSAVPFGQGGGSPVGASPPVASSLGMGGEPPLMTVPFPTNILDPLAEAPNAVWYVRPPTGGQFGPAPADVMRNWIAEGRVSPDSLVWREGWRDWQEAGQVFPQLSSPAGFSPAPTSVRQVGGGRPVRKDSAAQNLWLLLLLVVAVAVLLGVFIYVAFGPTRPAPSPSSPDTASSEKAAPVAPDSSKTPPGVPTHSATPKK